MKGIERMFHYDRHGIAMTSQSSTSILPRRSWLILTCASLLAISVAQSQNRLDGIVIRQGVGIDSSDVELVDDTLSIVSVADSLFSPFGREDDFRKIIRKYPGLSVKRRVVEMFGDRTYKMTTYQLSYHRSFVKFYKESEENGGEYEIFFGRIVNDEMIPWRGIKIGMPEKDFVMRFLQDVSPQLLNRIRVVEIDTGPMGTPISFVFNASKLEAISFDSEFGAKDIGVEY